MENIDKKILEDYHLLVARLDIKNIEIKEQSRAYNKLRKTFIELLEVYQGELDRKGFITYDRQDVDYSWCEKAGILD